MGAVDMLMSEGGRVQVTTAVAVGSCGLADATAAVDVDAAEWRDAAAAVAVAAGGSSRVRLCPSANCLVAVVGDNLLFAAAAMVECAAA